MFEQWRASRLSLCYQLCLTCQTSRVLPPKSWTCIIITLSGGERGEKGVKVVWKCSQRHPPVSGRFGGIWDASFAGSDDPQLSSAIRRKRHPVISYRFRAWEKVFYFLFEGKGTCRGVCALWRVYFVWDRLCAKPSRSEKKGPSRQFSPWGTRVVAPPAKNCWFSQFCSRQASAKFYGPFKLVLCCRRWKASTVTTTTPATASRTKRRLRKCSTKPSSCWKRRS